MRAGGVALAIGLMLLAAAPAQAQAWMTFVARDVSSGERLGLGARVDNDDAEPALAIVCTDEGLTATFSTGVAISEGMVLADMAVPLSVSADGGDYNAFATTAESLDIGGGPTIRLRFTEPNALVDHVMGGASTITVSYRVGTDELAFAQFDNGSAPVSVGAVLGECAGREG